MIGRILMVSLVALLVGALIGIGAANIAVVNWCVAQGGQPATPFLTTECRFTSEIRP